MPTKTAAIRWRQPKPPHIRQWQRLPPVRRSACAYARPAGIPLCGPFTHGMQQLSCLAHQVWRAIDVDWRFVVHGVPFVRTTSARWPSAPSVAHHRARRNVFSGLWSEDVGYPQPRRVIHIYPQNIVLRGLSVSHISRAIFPTLLSCRHCTNDMTDGMIPTATNAGRKHNPVGSNKRTDNFAAACSICERSSQIQLFDGCFQTFHWRGATVP